MYQLLKENVMNNILADNENSTNRMLINLNWIISLSVYLYLLIKREYGLSNSPYGSLFVSAMVVLLLLVVSEMWFFKFNKKVEFRKGLKYFVLSSAIIIFISVSYVSKDPYMLAIFYYPLVASALYYNNKLTIYIIVFELLSISTLLLGGYIDSNYEISIIEFCIEIAFSVAVGILVLVRYSNTSRKVTTAIKIQKENLKVSNDKLIDANSQLNEHQQSLIELNDTLARSNEDLEEAYKELRRSQTQLIYHEKMASLGKLAAGVAHEINNPVGVINCNVDSFDKLICSLKAAMPGDEKRGAKEILSKLDTVNQINFMACRRIVEIVKSLRNFTRLDQAEYQNADIHEGIDNTLVLLKNRLKGNVEIIKEYGNIPLVRCSANQLNQVFLNLIVNAADAVDDKGTIWIKTYMKDDKVFISIRDNGTGIPAEYLDRIFESGFTTKEVGKGTGLGLAIVYNIIEKHGGKIEIKSKEGEGSEFIIELPVKQEYLEQIT